MNLRTLFATLLPNPVKRAIQAWSRGDLPSPPSPAGPSSAAARLRYGHSLMYALPGDIISDAVLATGVWEPSLSKALFEDAREGGLLVEVGANLGYFSLLWASVSAENRVLAFEPAARNLHLFQQSITANHLNQQITLLPVAAGNDVRLSAFDLGPEPQTGWGGIVLDPARATTPTQVIVVPLDQILKDIPSIQVLKIDVEGADTLVLEGSRRLLRERRINKIYYEQNHPRMAAIGVAPEAAQILLAELGYQTHPMTPDTEEVVEWVATPAR